MPDTKKMVLMRDPTATGSSSIQRCVERMRGTAMVAPNIVR